MTEKLPYKVGQTLWHVSGGRNPQETEVTIKKVGRVWADLEGYFGRIDKFGTVYDKGYSAPAQCYASKAAYESMVLLSSSWSRLQSDIRVAYRPPDIVTLERIAEARALLGLPT